jgi:dolichol-phosphate mannosyltransferase
MASTASHSPETIPPARPARVAVLLCTYNEAQNLPELYLQLRRHLPQADILVVDDNSPDGTSACVQALPGYQETATSDSADSGSAVFLLKRSGKQGLGTATRLGLQWCISQSYDFVINLDADLSHAPEYAPILLSACTDERLAGDVAVGSRYVAGGGMRGLPMHRRLISRLLNAYATRLLRLPVRDCSGSFRCYRVTALQQLDFASLTCPGYGFLEEILVALHRTGAKLIELPIEFHTRSQGQSKLGFSDAWGAIRVIHRLAMRD